MRISQNENYFKKMKLEIHKKEEIRSKANIWKSIKSPYNLKEIFSFININQKLNIIIYNKQLQKEFGINIENYKIISGKYKIDGINWKGSEYTINTIILLFEGEYLNKKRNGYGKEYFDNGNLKIEGEYLNGKKNGKVKEYNYYGQLIFEGEYKNWNKWNGKEREYYYNDNLKYEEEYLNGKKSGIMKKYDFDEKLIFEGNINGKGKEYFNNSKLKFEGEYLNGKRNGKGKVYYDNGKLKFEGEKNGKGKEYNDNGKLKFEGEYLNGEKNGKYKEYNNNGELIFKGEYKKDLFYDFLEYTKDYFNEEKNMNKMIGISVSDILKLQEKYLNGEKNGEMTFSFVIIINKFF